MNQAGFSLFELMIAMTILALLTVISVPTYQGYVQRAALTALLQYLVPDKNSVELCLITSNIKNCDNGQQDIPISQSNRYAKSIQVSQGKITVSGQDTLDTLAIEFTPNFNQQIQQITWNTQCVSTQNKLKQLCETVFKL